MKHLCVFICCLFALILSGQESLQIRRVSLRGLKITEVRPGQTLEYRLKGESHYRRDEIVSLSDSTIHFGSDRFITLSQIRNIKLRGLPRLLEDARKLAIRGGILLPLVDMTNNVLVFHRDEILNPKVAIISAGFLSTAIILKLCSVRHVRINSRNTLKIIDKDYFNFRK